VPIDPNDLAKSIGALGGLDSGHGLAPTPRQVADSAKQLFATSPKATPSRPGRGRPAPDMEG
jgi:hypothetical protein